MSRQLASYSLLYVKKRPNCISGVAKTKDSRPSKGIGLVAKDFDDLEKKREELKAKRKRLFALFLRNPAQIRLAIEIKKIDDQVAECAEHLRLPQ